DAIATGNFYPGWLAESNHGYGDPSFRFYPPALYYLLALFRFITGEWYVATLLTFALVSVAGGLGVFFWARSVLPSSQAMWASILYSVAPYHVNQVYQATMLAEWAGAAVLPFVFAFLERVCTHGKRRDVAGLAGCYALLVLTHLPLTVIGSIALLVYALMRLDAGRRLQTLLKLAAAAGLGLCASAIYWVTMISELRWIGVNSIYYDSSVDYRYNFLLSTFSPDNLNVWWMNILAFMTLLLGAPVILFLRRHARHDRPPLKSVVVLTAFAVFMAVPLSRPVWQLLSPLQETQFPWRWLVLVSLGVALLAGAAIPLLDHADKMFARAKRLGIVGAMSIAVVFTFSHSVREAKFLTPSAFNHELDAVRGTVSVSSWFPVWASSSPTRMSQAVEAADRSVVVNTWAPERRQFSIGAGTRAEARLKTFYYPHWAATSGNQVFPTRPDKDGALLVSLPADALTVEVVFNEPRRSRLAAVASFAGFMFIGVLTLPFRLRRKH
ncbi:MAG TPA: 6-pyruvoyl-tetrahydropterin synthase-related protein, partial [Pyrinomonadaceae bacterium]|nr:6-pyruvoyl-tetrahydropterin synthase-related protein [Pyrinomonadaceae bacterium]